MREMMLQLQARDQAGDADFVFTCGLTMEPFRDPVVTPDGNSYERAALIEHLHKVPFLLGMKRIYDLLLPQPLLHVCCLGGHWGLVVKSVSLKKSSMLCVFIQNDKMAMQWLGNILPTLLSLQVGQLEPVTRRPLVGEQLVSNTRLREATQQYLDEHPWAWKECTS